MHLEKELYENGKSVLYTDLIKLIVKISDYIMQSETTIKEGVSNIVGGKILELESERIQRQTLENIISINQMLKEGKSIEDIVLLGEFSETLVKQVFEKVYQTD